MKVLIVEAEIELVESISLVLHMEWPDIQVIFTHMGSKGVELAKVENPDFVLVDMGLPDMDGFEFIRNIRRFYDVPIIILTVIAEEAYLAKALEYGCDDYIVKPFGQKELLAQVRETVRNK